MGCLCLSSTTKSKMAGGIQLPPFRSLQDVLTDAQFTLPTFGDLERMNNRMINNLLYYQTNYFLWFIAIFLIVGTLYPKDLIIGAVTVAVSIIIYANICKDKQETSRHEGSAIQYLVPVAVGAIVLLLMHMLGSVLVFLWGFAAPISVILLHSACRKRNLRNKFTNVAETFKENPSPMTMILSAVCIEPDKATAVRMGIKGKTKEFMKDMRN